MADFASFICLFSPWLGCPGGGAVSPLAEPPFPAAYSGRCCRLPRFSSPSLSSRATHLGSGPINKTGRRRRRNGITGIKGLEGGGGGGKRKADRFFCLLSAAWFLCPLLDSFIHDRDSPLKKNFLWMVAKIMVRNYCGLLKTKSRQSIYQIWQMRRKSHREDDQREKVKSQRPPSLLIRSRARQVK